MKRTNSARIRALKTLCLSLTCLSAVPLLEAPAAAQSGKASDAAQKSYDFNIAGQSLSSALTAFAAETGLQIVYSQEDAGQIASPGAKGRMSADAALARITAGTGYTFQYLRAGVVTLVKAGAAGNDGEVVTGVVSVEGVQGSPYLGGAGRDAGVNGVNGSRDITATEGTGSFTSGALTIGSKVPQALKDVPQSISVLTGERLEQQNVTDFTTAMQQLPGITLVQGNSSLENTFYSRGFAVQSIQVDGGAPLSTGYGFAPQIDMSVYDHVELLRGADGLFNGYGDPGGTVNLVRKKPLDHPQFTLDAEVGSWQNYRVVADATSPLALDGRLRGRLVMTYQDNHYFYDDAKDNKNLLYGILELDPSPTTVLTAGIDYTKQNSEPWFGGLPRYLNGDDIKLPRSTSFVFPWNRWDFETTEIFGGVEQKLGGDWVAKLDATWNRQNSYRKLGYSLGAVNPTNDLGPILTGTYNDYASDQLSLEGTLSGSFMLLGQRQELTVGINRVSTSGGGTTLYNNLISGTSAAPYRPYPGGPAYYSGSPNGTRPPIDVFDFNPNDPIYNEPSNPLPSTYYPALGTVQYVAYANLRLTAFDRLHLTTGFRWSRHEYRDEYDSLCTTMTGNCAGRQIGDIYSTTQDKYAASDVSWPPSVTLSFDLTKQLTAYAGYTDIYQSQANDFTTDGAPLDPITGSNWEGGIKWAPNGGRLNLSLAAYRVEEKGFAALVGQTSTDLGGGRTCCFVSSPNQTYFSQGIDFEATGQIMPGWQISASYTYNENKYKGIDFGAADGLPLVTLAPKQLYKVWTSYDFGAAGHSGLLSALTISAGINGQSSGFQSGTVCVNFVGVPNPVTGAQSCATNLPPNRIPYSFVVPSYAVVSGRIDYRLSDKWSLAINVENIFDKTYYQTTGVFTSGGNWYGAPRSFTASVRAKW